MCKYPAVEHLNRAAKGGKYHIKTQINLKKYDFLITSMKKNWTND